MLGLGIAAAAVEPVRTYFLPLPGGWTRNEAGGFFVPDDFVQAIKNVNSGARLRAEMHCERGAILLFHPETIDRLKKLLDKHGRPLWSPRSDTVGAMSSIEYVSTPHGPDKFYNGRPIIPKLGDLLKL